MLTRFMLPLSILTVACSTNVRETRLSDVDLSDSTVLSRLQDQLQPAERASLSTFVVRHMATSARFCGQPLVGSDGLEPRTIGEAITLTRIREATEKAAMAQLLAPRSGPVSPHERRALLISDRDHLISKQSMLRLKFGPAAQQHPDWPALAADLARLDGQLASNEEMMR